MPGAPFLVSVRHAVCVRECQPDVSAAGEITSCPQTDSRATHSQHSSLVRGRVISARKGGEAASVRAGSFCASLRLYLSPICGRVSGRVSIGSVSPLAGNEQGAPCRSHPNTARCVEQASGRSLAFKASRLRPSGLVSTHDVVLDVWGENGEPQDHPLVG